jgi:hypothetical protein
VRAARQPAPSLETLEQRVVPTLVGEFQVNSTFLHDQYDPAVAVAANGRKIVVWPSAVDANFNNIDIKAQQYDENGDPVGDELTIAGTSDQEYDPSVAMDALGNFIVTWSVNPGNGGNTDVRFAVFSFGSGAPQLAAGDVAHSTTLDEYFSSVAADAAGNFVVAYQTEGSGGATDRDIYAVRYSAQGTPLGPTITVSAKPRLGEDGPAVTRAPGGKFAVVYNFADTQIRLRRYSAKGAVLGTETIAKDADSFSTPDVAMDAKGNCVVVWERDLSGVGGTTQADVYSRWVTKDGDMGPKRTMASGPGDQYDPTVAIDSATDNYVVAVEQYDPDNDVNTVLVTQRTKQGLQVNEPGEGIVTLDALDDEIGGFDNDGFYFLAYELPNVPDRGDGDGSGVFATLGSIHGLPT